VARLPTRHVLLALCGLLAMGLPRAAAQTVPPPRPVDEQVVFAVDGSGWLRGIGDDLRRALAEARMPIEVESFTWSHGPGRVFSDLHGHEHQKAKGLELADLILAHHKLCPTGKVYVVCHSSGAAVVLAAAQHLPAASVERMVLLAPALAPTCDMRPTLRCVRRGIDSFHSPTDVIGGFVLAVIGNADGHFQSSAGCVGFTPADDDPLYTELRQHAWDWEMSKTGYYGGHFGCTRGGFLRAYVVPLLAGND
jgi:Alpha/beta hydrolase family